MVQIIIYPQSSFYSFDLLLKEIYQFYSIPDSICVFEECCLTKPCKKGSTIQIYKNINLPYQVNTNEKYIILYQNNILESIESELLKIQAGQTEFSATQFLRCIQNEKKKNLFFLQSFIFNQTNNQNYLIVEYNQYKQNELDDLKKILQFLNPYFDFQSNYLSKILYKNNYSIDYTQYLKINMPPTQPSVQNTNTIMNLSNITENDELSEYETITDSDEEFNDDDEDDNSEDDDDDDSDDDGSDDDDDDSDDDDDDDSDDDDDDDDSDDDSKNNRKMMKKNKNKNFLKKKKITKQKKNKKKMVQTKNNNNKKNTLNEEEKNIEPKKKSMDQKRRQMQKKRRQKKMKKQIKSIGLLFFLKRMRQQFQKK
jgi:hypothetical protein